MSLKIPSPIGERAHPPRPVIREERIIRPARDRPREERIVRPERGPQQVVEIDPAALNALEEADVRERVREGGDDFEVAEVLER